MRNKCYFLFPSDVPETTEYYIEDDYGDDYTNSGAYEASTVVTYRYEVDSGRANSNQQWRETTRYSGGDISTSEGKS